MPSGWMFQFVTKGVGALVNFSQRSSLSYQMFDVLLGAQKIYESLLLAHFDKRCVTPQSPLQEYYQKMTRWDYLDIF